MTSREDSVTLTDITVTAEEAPLGVQLWPTTGPEYAVNFTLAEVATVRTGTRTFVRWTYQSGQSRTFKPGERVACRLDLTTLHTLVTA